MRQNHFEDEKAKRHGLPRRFALRNDKPKGLPGVSALLRFACLCLFLLAPAGAGFAAQAAAPAQAAPPAQAIAPAQAPPTTAPAIGTASPAEKETKTEFSVGMAARVSNRPYKSYATQWEPVPIVSLEHERFYIRDYTAGVKLLNLKYFEFSVFGEYDDTNFDASDSSERRMKRLKDRDSTAMIGTEARLITPLGMLHASAARDVLGTSDGWKGAIGYKNVLEYGPVEFIPALGAHWASDRYNDYYYGVSKHQSRKSGVGRYEAKGGFSPYAGLTVDYSVNDNWDVFCSGEMIFLSDEVKDSTMVDSTRTQSVTAGFMYNF